MAVYTDLADELYGGQRGTVPPGVQIQTLRTGPILCTRMEITRPHLARPMGRYVTVDLPPAAALDARDPQYCGVIAAELRRLLPRTGPILVVGVGNRRITADALGPRTAGQILVTRGLAGQRFSGLGLRPVAAIAPGTGGTTGVTLSQLLRGLVRTLRPAAVLCVDSLAACTPARLGRTVQITDTGLCPARPGSGRCLTSRLLGVPVLALGIPTMMDADALCGCAGLTLTPKELDPLIRRGSALLALAINRALQPELTLPELGYLVS